MTEGRQGPVLLTRQGGKWGSGEEVPGMASGVAGQHLPCGEEVVGGGAEPGAQ